MTNIKTLNGKSLTEKAALVRFSAGRGKGWVRDKKVTDEVLTSKKASRGSGNFRKKLWGEHIDTIHRIYFEMYNYHRSVTLPWLDEGIRIIPATLLIEYMQEMGKYKEKFFKAITHFKEIIIEAVEEDKNRLGDLFDTRDYPTNVEDWFYFDIKIYPLPVANDFRIDVGKDHINQLKNELETEQKTLLRETIKHCWNLLYESVDRLVNRLNAKQFRADFLDLAKDHLTDLCNLLPKLNIAGDGTLENIRQKVEQKVLSLLPSGEILKENDRERDRFLTETQNIFNDMKAFMEDKIDDS